MSTTHTPGPWKAYDATAGTHIVAENEEGDARVAYVKVCLADFSPKAQQANARLIAAAPELLAALEALVGEADLGEVDLDDGDRTKLDNARAAIAKAKGANA